MTEQELRQRVVATANQWIGIKQGSAAHAALIETYNTITPLPRSHKMSKTEYWCAAYVSAVAVQASVTDIFALECSCTKMVEQYKQMGRWMEKDDYRPSPGDVPFYRWDDGANYKTTDQTKNPNHVGIVVESNGDSFVVIEGNRTINGVSQVAYRTMEVNGRYIRGFGLPDYAKKADTHWYTPEMEWAKSIGLLDGTRPLDACTRAELATALHRLYDLTV